MTSAAWNDRTDSSPGVRPVAVSSGRRLAPVVYDLLKERLLEGEYQAGERLSVEALKAEFGVSKQPVMEALRRLSSEGLVEIIPQVGCRVPVYGSADVSDFFAIFGGMEGAVAGVAAQRCTDAQVDELAAVNDADQAAHRRPRSVSARPRLPHPEPALPRHHPRHGPLRRGGRDQPPDVGHVRPADQHQRGPAAAGIGRARTPRRPRAHHRARSATVTRPPPAAQWRTTSPAPWRSSTPKRAPHADRPGAPMELQCAGDQLALRVSLVAIPIPVIHSVTGS